MMKSLAWLNQEYKNEGCLTPADEDARQLVKDFGKRPLEQQNPSQISAAGSI